MGLILASNIRITGSAVGLGIAALIYLTIGGDFVGHMILDALMNDRSRECD